MEAECMASSENQDGLRCNETTSTAASEQLANGSAQHLQDKQQGNVKNGLCYYSRKRVRDKPRDVAMKKAKITETNASQTQQQSMACQEAKIDATLGRTADILLVLAGLGQMRAARTPSTEEKYLAAEAYRNLESLVMRVPPNNLMAKSSVKSTIDSLGFQQTKVSAILDIRQPEAAEINLDLERADSGSESSESMDDYNIPSSPSTAQSNYANVNMQSYNTSQSRDYHQSGSAGYEYGHGYRQNGSMFDLGEEDRVAMAMRHKRLAKTVYQILAEATLPKPNVEISNAYINQEICCMLCGTSTKETANLLVCDQCERAYHYKCMTYTKGVPRELEWYCQKCALEADYKQHPRYGVIPKQPQKQPTSSAAMVAAAAQAAAAAALAQAAQAAAMANGITTATAAVSNAAPVEEEITTEQSEEDVLLQQQDDEGGIGTEDTGVETQAQVCLQVDWVGEGQRSEEKVFYSSCCVGGWTYKLQDCALFRPESPEMPPFIARLQLLWEDMVTGSKHVSVNWCYYPSDMLVLNVPNAPGYPDPDEVYESNHSDSNAIGSIQGPCQVLPPKLYEDEKAKRAELLESGISISELPPLFLCKWRYDAHKGVFQRAT